MLWLFNFGILMSRFFSLGIPMSWDIKFLQNSNPYAPDIATSSISPATVGCLFSVFIS